MVVGLARGRFIWVVDWLGVVLAGRYGWLGVPLGVPASSRRNAFLATGAGKGTMHVPHHLATTLGTAVYRLVPLPGVLLCGASALPRWW